MPAAEIPTSLLRHNFILTSSIVARATVFSDGLRFDPSLRIGEDLDLCIRVIRDGFKPAFERRATLNYRKHPTSTTADSVRFPEEFAKVAEKYLGDPIVDQIFCRRAVEGLLLDVARMTWRHEPARARAALTRLFRVNPWALRAWPYAMLTWSRGRASIPDLSPDALALQ